jgi:hypothetical protein
MEGEEEENISEEEEERSNPSQIETLLMNEKGGRAGRFDQCEGRGWIDVYLRVSTKHSCLMLFQRITSTVLFVV